MINTYNESILHNKFKKAAAQRYEGKIEQAVGQYICDVVAKDGTIIEIQTSGFKSIYKKLVYLLQTHPVRLTYPLAIETFIEYYDKNGNLLSRRKSPVKKNLYHIFDELTGLWPLLAHKGFTFEAIETVIIKKRKRTEKPVQSANNKRRYKKNWYAVGTDIERLGKSICFCGKRDYLNLLPESLPKEFGVKDIRIHTAQTLKSRQANEMLWTLCKAEFIERIGKKGRAFTYSILI